MSFAPRLKSRLTRAGDPFTFRERLEKVWTDSPSTTITAAVKLTGAPRSVAETIRRRLAAMGKLKPGTERSS